MIEVVSPPQDVHLWVLHLGQAQRLEVVHLLNEACRQEEPSNLHKGSRSCEGLDCHGAGVSVAKLTVEVPAVDNLWSPLSVVGEPPLGLHLPIFRDLPSLLSLHPLEHLHLSPQLHNRKVDPVVRVRQELGRAQGPNKVHQPTLVLRGYCMDTVRGHHQREPLSQGAGRLQRSALVGEDQVEGQQEGQ